MLLKVEITDQSQCSANTPFSRHGFEAKSYSIDWRVRNQNEFVHSVKDVVYWGSRSRFSWKKAIVSEAEFFLFGLWIQPVILILFPTFHELE